MDIFFYCIACVAIICFGLASVGLLKGNKWTNVIGVIGVSCLLLFFAILWIFEQHPPMKTVWETRYLFACCSSLIGYVCCFQWKSRLIGWYGFLLSTVFLILNIVKYDTFGQQLPMALQSIWYVPHVLVYMFGYAFLAIAALIGIKGLFSRTDNVDKQDFMIQAGFSCQTIGMIIGAVWAKNVWGGYWTWDVKELWALISWLVYMLYIHFRISHRNMIRLAQIVSVLAFLLVLFCWFGLNYVMQTESLHTYR